jgi:hypothetical protein
MVSNTHKPRQRAVNPLRALLQGMARIEKKLEALAKKVSAKPRGESARKARAGPPPDQASAA